MLCSRHSIYRERPRTWHWRNASIRVLQHEMKYLCHLLSIPTPEYLVQFQVLLCYPNKYRIRKKVWVLIYTQDLAVFTGSICGKISQVDPSSLAAFLNLLKNTRRKLLLSTEVHSILLRFSAILLSAQKSHLH